MTFASANNSNLSIKQPLMDRDSETPEPMPATLDPPGSIAVIGAGPLGIEAALYGRYLGYDVTLFESHGIASSMDGHSGDPIPMMPDRCLSPLARSALQAQCGSEEPWAFPLQIGEWVDRVWCPLLETDLLRGRLRCPVTVEAIDWVEVDDDEPIAEDEEAIPPDFRLSLSGDESVPLEGSQFEAVILACGTAGDRIRRSFPTPADYFFSVGQSPTGDAEEDFWHGLSQIVAIYASLGGRLDLDLYRPLRG